MKKIEKRLCRKAVASGYPVPQEEGLLHAKQITYLVTTAVKVIGHHRILILFVYEREALLNGEKRPVYTVFHTKDDFQTLFLKADGSTCWRRASFEHLPGNGWNFQKQCAFASLADEGRVTRYFGSEKEGFAALLFVQSQILERRRKLVRREKERRILQRMNGVGALPRGLTNWISSVMPAYFFYDYRRGVREVAGVCSCCGAHILRAGIKQGRETTCPACGHKLIAKPRSRRGSAMYDRDTFVVLQKTAEGGVVVRIVKAYASYTADVPTMQIYENARQFLWQDDKGALHIELYYLSSDGILTNWKQGIRPQFCYYTYHFEGDTCGYLYPKNLPKALTGTPWQYCPIALFSNHRKGRMEVLPFLREYRLHPKLEHLVKRGFYQLSADLVYGNDRIHLAET